MGLFDFLTGSKAPRPGTERQSVAGLRKSLMAVNRETAPFVIRDGKKEGVDMVAEWRIVDAKWYEIFAKAGIKKVFTQHRAEVSRSTGYKNVSGHRGIQK